MSEIFELEAQARETHGTANSRRLRQEEIVPAVIYGAKKPAKSISLSQHLVNRALENEAFFSHILTIDLDGKKEQVVVKDIQRHPYKTTILHMDFLRIKANEKLERNVPVHFTNEESAPGIREGGVATHHMTEVEVSCLPANLPEFIEVDLSNLELNGNIHLSELKLPAGVELTALQGEEPQNHIVVSIHPPRVIEEPEEVSAEAGETTEEQSAAEEGENSGEEKSAE